MCHEWKRKRNSTERTKIHIPDPSIGSWISPNSHGFIRSGSQCDLLQSSMGLRSGFLGCIEASYRVQMPRPVFTTNNGLTLRRYIYIYILSYPRLSIRHDDVSLISSRGRYRGKISSPPLHGIQRWIGNAVDRRRRRGRCCIICCRVNIVPGKYDGRRIDGEVAELRWWELLNWN